MQEIQNLFHWKSHGRVNISSFLKAKQSLIQVFCVVCFNTQQGRSIGGNVSTWTRRNVLAKQFLICILFTLPTQSLNISLCYRLNHCGIKILVAISVSFKILAFLKCVTMYHHTTSLKIYKNNNYLSKIYPGISLTKQAFHFFIFLSKVKDSFQDNRESSVFPQFTSF